MDFEESPHYDIRLLRGSPALPKHIKLHGFAYEMNAGQPLDQHEARSTRAMRGNPQLSVRARENLGWQRRFSLTFCR